MADRDARSAVRLVLEHSYLFESEDVERMIKALEAERERRNAVVLCPKCKKEPAGFHIKHMQRGEKKQCCCAGCYRLSGRDENAKECLDCPWRDQRGY